MDKTRGLGRGLSSLLGGDDFMDETPGSTVHELDIELVEPNFKQPRKIFSEDALNELAQSIIENGIIQPIIVRKLDYDKYQIIAGERRWRASKIAGLSKISAIVKEFSEEQILPIALIENIQREGLSPIEEADSYSKLLEDFNYTQEELAKILGKTRSYISNIVRLVNLPEEIKDMLNNQTISMGHARSLLNVEDNIAIANHIVANGLNVRETENLIKNWGIPPVIKAPIIKITPAVEAKIEIIPQAEIDPISEEISEELKSIEELLTANLGVKVSIDQASQGGKLTFHYQDFDELNNILQKLSDNI